VVGEALSSVDLEAWQSEQPQPSLPLEMVEAEGRTRAEYAFDDYGIVSLSTGPSFTVK